MLRILLNFKLNLGFNTRKLFFQIQDLRLSQSVVWFEILHHLLMCLKLHFNPFYFYHYLVQNGLSDVMCQDFTLFLKFPVYFRDYLC